MVFAVHTFTLKEILKGNSHVDHTLVWGEKNKVAPIHSQGYLHKALLKPNRFEIIEGGSHLCMYENSERTMEIIDTAIKVN